MKKADLNRKYAELGKWALDLMSEEWGDIDGSEIQDKAEELGLLTRVKVDKPCGEYCTCAEWGDFPQDCLRRIEKCGT